MTHAEEVAILHDKIAKLYVEAGEIVAERDALLPLLVDDPTTLNSWEGACCFWCRAEPDGDPDLIEHEPTCAWITARAALLPVTEKGTSTDG